MGGGTIAVSNTPGMMKRGRERASLPKRQADEMKFSKREGNGSKELDTKVGRRDR